LIACATEIKRFEIKIILLQSELIQVRITIIACAIKVNANAIIVILFRFRSKTHFLLVNQEREIVK